MAKLPKRTALGLALIGTLGIILTGCDNAASGPPPNTPGASSGTAGEGTAPPGALKPGAPPGGMTGATPAPK